MQYRSGVYTTDPEQAAAAEARTALAKQGYAPIITKIQPLKTFNFAEDYR